MVALREDYEYNNTDEINAFIAVKNPFRYRSYYYDFETNLYYLNSRYYDPQIGRFINADNISNVDKSTFNGLNLYAYCVNNPVMLTDSQGESWWSDFWKGVKNFFKKVGDVIAGTFLSTVLVIGGLLLTIFSVGTLHNIGGALIGAGIGGFLGGLDSYLNGGSYWAGYRGGAIAGSISAFAASFGIKLAFFGGFIGNLLGTLVTDGFNGENLSGYDYWKNLIAESISGGLISMLAWGLGGSATILKTLGLRGLFAGFSVMSEFAFSYLSENVMNLLEILVKNIKLRILRG